MLRFELDVKDTDLVVEVDKLTLGDTIRLADAVAVLDKLGFELEVVVAVRFEVIVLVVLGVCVRVTFAVPVAVTVLVS